MVASCGTQDTAQTVLDLKPIQDAQISHPVNETNESDEEQVEDATSNHTTESILKTGVWPSVLYFSSG